MEAFNQIVLSQSQELIPHKSFSQAPIFSFSSVNLDHGSIQTAISRAIEACINSGFDPERHFRSFFISHNDNLIQHWQLTKLAYLLVVLNGDTTNINVSRLQMELLRRLNH